MQMLKAGIAMPRTQQGAAMMEYLLITLLVVIALIASPNAVGEIISALKEVYRAFVFAIGTTYPTPGPGT